MSNFSVVSPQQIMSSQLNKSYSKQLYSFPKSVRFKRILLSCDQSYDQPSTKKQRAAGFGYGKKFDFTRCKTDGPEPTLYNLNSLFEDNKSFDKGVSFGLGRGQMKECSYITHGLLKNPGPGQYNKTEPNLTKQRAFSLRQKTENPWMPNFLKQKNSFHGIPGPGQYDQIKSIEGNGKYFYSKYKSSGAPLINSGQKRFLIQRRGIPGPGQYNSTYNISKYKDQGKRLFGSEKRKSFIDDAVRYSELNIMPGPGNYRQHSEFGVYENPALMVKQIRPQTAENNHRLSSKSQSRRMNTTISQF